MINTMLHFLSSALFSFGLFLFLGLCIKAIYANIDHAQEQESKKRVRCNIENDLHNWTYHPVTKILTCTKCNYEAGSND